MAEVFEAMMDIVSETYKLDKEEMLATIQAHPKFTEIQLHPVLDDMGFGLAEPAAAPTPLEKPVVAEPTPAPKLSAAERIAAKRAAAIAKRQAELLKETEA